MYICIFCSISPPIYTYTLKYDLFIKNSKTKILIFEYFPKIPSEMNSTHSLCEIFTFTSFGCRGVPGDPKNLKIFFMISKNHFN